MRTLAGFALVLLFGGVSTWADEPRGLLGGILGGALRLDEDRPEIRRPSVPDERALRERISGALPPPPEDLFSRPALDERSRAVAQLERVEREIAQLQERRLSDGARFAGIERKLAEDSITSEQERLAGLQKKLEDEKARHFRELQRIAEAAERQGKPIHLDPRVLDAEKARFARAQRELDAQVNEAQATLRAAQAEAERAKSLDPEELRRAADERERRAEQLRARLEEMRDAPSDPPRSVDPREQSNLIDPIRRAEQEWLERQPELKGVMDRRATRAQERAQELEKVADRAVEERKQLEETPPPGVDPGSPAWKDALQNRSKALRDGIMRAATAERDAERAALQERAPLNEEKPQAIDGQAFAGEWQDATGQVYKVAVQGNELSLTTPGGAVWTGTVPGWHVLWANLVWYPQSGEEFWGTNAHITSFGGAANPEEKKTLDRELISRGFEGSLWLADVRIGRPMRWEAASPCFNSERGRLTAYARRCGPWYSALLSRAYRFRDIRFTQPVPPFGTVEIVPVGGRFRVEVSFEPDAPPPQNEVPVRVKGPTGTPLEVMAKRVSRTVFRSDPIRVGQEIAAQPGDDIEVEFQGKGFAAARVVDNKPVIVIENEAGRIVDTVLKDEPFQIRVLVPRHEEALPATIEVTLDSDKWWALSKSVPLSNVDVDLGGAFATYLSDPLTIWQHWFRQNIGERFTASYRDASETFYAYNTMLEFRLGKVEKALDQAEDLYRRYLDQILPEIAKEGLSPDEAQATREMIEQKLGLIGRTRQILASDALDYHERAAIGESLVQLLGTDPAGWAHWGARDAFLSGDALRQQEHGSRVIQRVRELGLGTLPSGLTAAELEAIASGKIEADMSREQQFSSVERGYRRAAEEGIEATKEGLLTGAAHLSGYSSLYTLGTGETWDGNPATLGDYWLAGSNLVLTAAPFARLLSVEGRAVGTGATTAVRGARTGGSRATAGELAAGSRGAAAGSTGAAAGEFGALPGGGNLAKVIPGEELVPGQRFSYPIGGLGNRNRIPVDVPVEVVRTPGGRPPVQRQCTSKSCFAAAQATVIERATGKAFPHEVLTAVYDKYGLLRVNRRVRHPLTGELTTLDDLGAGRMSRGVRATRPEIQEALDDITRSQGLRVDRIPTGWSSSQATQGMEALLEKGGHTVAGLKWIGRGGHAVVVEQITADAVIFGDPWFGASFRISRGAFERLLDPRTVMLVQ